MLLTRSPLSPGPKPRFSLDLHVLGAPPAFVLSQDQTLREDRFAFEAEDGLGCKLIQVSLSSIRQVPSEEGLTGFALPTPKRERVSTFTLLSFQRPCPHVRCGA